MRHWLTAAVLVLAVLGPERPAGAYDTSTPLLGLTALDILVEVPKRGVEQCGVDRPSIETALRVLLGQSPIPIGPGADDYIYLSWTIAPDCVAASYELDVNAVVAVRATGTIVYGARIWSGGGLIAGSKDSLAADLTRRVEETARLLVNDWSTAHPK